MRVNRGRLDISQGRQRVMINPFATLCISIPREIVVYHKCKRIRAQPKTTRRGDQHRTTAANLKDQRPKTKDQRPKTKDQRPKIKDQRPKTKDQRPKTKDQRSKTKDQRPQTKDQRPKTKDQSNQQPATCNQQPATSVCYHNVQSTAQHCIIAPFIASARGTDMHCQCTAMPCNEGKKKRIKTARSGA